jgi:hypothetical protein
VIRLLILVALLGTTSAASAAEREAVAWQPSWRKMSLLEGLSLIPIGAALAAVTFLTEPREQAHWRGGILFDDGMRANVRGRTRSAQLTARTVGDILYIGGSIAPVVIDVGIVALGVHGNSEVALQMLLIDMQSFGIAGLLSLSSEHFVGRGRPFYEDCDRTGVVRDDHGQVVHNTCNDPTATKSFYGGHAAATATSAGLTCIHHQHMPLYGGGIADAVPCALMIGVSFVTGVSRMVADMHWASDTLLGWGVGATAGYVLPAVLHYGFASDGDRRALRMLPVARVGGGYTELGFIQAF